MKKRIANSMPISALSPVPAVSPAGSSPITTVPASFASGSPAHVVGGSAVTLLASDRLEAEAAATGRTFRSLAERDATAHLMKGQPAPQVGDPVWYLDTVGGLNHFTDVAQEFSPQFDGFGTMVAPARKVLGIVKYVKHLTDEEALTHNWIHDLPEGFFGSEFCGGSACVDDPEDKVYRSHLDYVNWFNLVAAIVTPSGRWYVADPQGHSYAKYIGAPVVWRDMWPECVEAERKHQQAEAERKQQKEAAEAERRAKAKAEVEQWSSILTKTGYYGDRKAVKKNLLTYLKHKFNSVRFTASRYCGTYQISWQNGPTADEVQKAASIFVGKSFNGYEDCDEFTHSEWMNAYGSIGYRPYTNRTLTEPHASAVRKQICDAFPGINADDHNHIIAPYNHEFITHCNKLGMSALFSTITDDHHTITGVQFTPSLVYSSLCDSYQVNSN